VEVAGRQMFLVVLMYGCFCCRAELALYEPRGKRSLIVLMYRSFYFGRKIQELESRVEETSMS
jgi:hypothetical protein